ncbi:MAG: PA14 domain-containing protein [Planctomycetota bacterium]
MLRSRLLAFLVLSAVTSVPELRAQRALAEGADPVLARARCAACHGDPGEAASAPDLNRAVRSRTRSALSVRLRDHARITEADSVALASYLLTERSAARTEVSVASGAVELGGQLWKESGCIACHEPDGIRDLAATSWFDAVDEFLGSRAKQAVPSHEFGFGADERHAVAAWLLRDQVRGDAPASQPGLQVECFELKITSAGLPELDGLTPASTGYATAVDVAKRTRNDHFALRFRGFLDVPADGEWRFWLGSDDSSWLWLDGELVVRNEGIAPYRERNAKRKLTRGMHRIEVVFTEAEGGEQLDLQWAGPGTSRRDVPAAVLSSSIVTLDGPQLDAPFDRELARRGEAIYRESRCAACHAPDAATPPSRRLAELDPARECASVPMTAATRRAVLDVGEPKSAAMHFERTLRVAQCVACHAVGEVGGLRAVARESAVETEDLGDEGRLPPSLTHAASQLKPEWIRKVVVGDARARPYLRIRMPHFDADTASAVATLAGALAPLAEDVAAATEVAAMRGRTLAGTGVGGYACVACHRVGGFASLGPQGMDLAQQAERLRPAWIREWLLDPTGKRPGTRMPAFFSDRSQASLARVDDLTVWLSLGRAMPLPDGIKTDGAGWRLPVTDRPRIHTAFLHGVSARGFAVATPIRVNWAYDFANARLAWVWRGEFLDVAGTWEGRAGRLLKPLGEDHLDLTKGADLRLSSGDEDSLLARVRGWRLDTEGHPIVEIQLGECRFEDALRPRITGDGSVMMRRLTVLQGRLRVRPPEAAGDAARIEPASERILERGDVAEFTYRW